MKTTLNNDGLTVEIFSVEQGFMARLIDDDSGGIVGQRIYLHEVDAIAYARLCLQLQHEADALPDSFTLGSDRFTRIGAATYNGLPRIFWQHWVLMDCAWVLNGTKCIHPDADADEVFDTFIDAPCEY